MPTALFIHHDANSETGLLGEAAVALGCEVIEHFICDDIGSGTASRPFPSLTDIDLVVLLGSRWSVYDRANIDTWLDAEVALIHDAVDRDVPVLGVCFGAQLLAHALGGSVAAADTEEIGWYRIELGNTLGALHEARRFALTEGPWFQWHLDVFTPPSDATTIATSPAGPQAFVVGRCLGLQFHPEVDRSVLASWMIADRDQLLDAGIDPDQLLADTDVRTDAAKERCMALLRSVIDRL